METTSVNDMSRKGKDILDKGYDKSKEALNTLADKAQDMDIKSYYDTAKSKTQSAVHASEDFVKKYPLYTVLGAAAVGYLAGWMHRHSRP